MKRIIYIGLLFNWILLFTMNAQAQNKSTSRSIKRTQKKYLKVANQEYELLRYSYAIPLYKVYLAKGGKDTVAYLNLANAYTLSNQYDSALKYMQYADQAGAKTYRHIPELQARLKQYEVAALGYKKIIDSNQTLLAAARLYGFSNPQQFYKDSLDYNVYPTKMNTTFNEFNAVPYKKGLVFESNRFNATKKLSWFKRVLHFFHFIYENGNEFAWDGKAFTNLYYVKDVSNIRVDTPILANWNEKRFTAHLTDYSVASSNDSKKLASSYGKERNTIKDSAITLFNQAFAKKMNLGAISFTAKGDKAYFTKNQSKSNDKHLLEVYESRFRYGQWTKPSRLFFNNRNYSYFHPCITPDGKRLYYVTDEPTGQGGTDIYYIDQNEDGSWKSTQNAGPDINTEGNELFPTFYNGHFYFSSNGHPGLGGLDIFQVDKDKTGLVIKNMGYPINSSKDDLAFSISGNSGFFSSNRYGSDDILAFDYQKALITMQGAIWIDSTCVPGKYVYLYQKDATGKEVIIDSAKVDMNCQYSFKVRPNQDYTLVALDDAGNKYQQPLSANGYELQTDPASAKNTFKQTVALINIPLSEKRIQEKLAAEQVIRAAEQSIMTPIFKKTIDSLMLLTKDYVELHHPFDQVYIIEKDLPDYYKIIERVKRIKGKKIIIVSAADCNGSLAYNEDLSSRRAKRIFKTLSKLSTNEVVIKNVGERELLKACDDLWKNKEEQVVNRYSYIFILDNK